MLQSPDMLVTFEEKYKLWRSWCALDTTEPNSIDQQLSSLLLSDMEYRVLLAARQLGNATLDNLLLRSFLNRGYVALQLLGIRKLTEKNGKHPSRGVISLKRLADDIRKHRSLFTRHNFVCRDHYSYELPLPFDGGLTNGESGFIAHGSPLDLWIRTRARHEQFDRISCKLPTQRLPDDLIDERMLNILDAWLADARIEEFRVQANKFIAHSADSISRQDLQPAMISLDLVTKVHALLIKAESLFVDVLLFPGIRRDATIRIRELGVINALAPDSLEARSSLQQQWDALAKERNEWRIKPESLAELMSKSSG